MLFTVPQVYYEYYKSPMPGLHSGLIASKNGTGFLFLMQGMGLHVS